MPSATTAEVIRHEAFHQFAANTGLHSRLAETPLWLGEGLAMMFESAIEPGLAPSRDAEQRARLRVVGGQRLSNVPPGWLKELVSSDRPFQVDPQGAYIRAWATVVYLSDRQLPRFTAYLRYLRSRPALEEYPAALRVADFERFFGYSWETLEREIARSVGAGR